MWFDIREAVEADIPDIYKHIHERFMKKYTDMDDMDAYGKHYEWYREALKSNEHAVHIIYDEKDRFIGQVRYEINKTSARVGIYLLEEVRGKGLGEKALNRSIMILTKKNKNLRKIIANIMDENYISLNLFEKCGFEYSRTKEDMLKYVKSIK